MAFFCLTVLEESTGGGHNKRQQAAQRYGIDADVLAKLGELTSELGDERTARKFKSGGRPHSDAEKAWIIAVVKMIIRRAGEYAHDPTAPRETVTMTDLPPLRLSS